MPRETRPVFPPDRTRAPSNSFLPLYPAAEVRQQQKSMREGRWLLAEIGRDAGQGSALSELDLYTQPVRKMDRPLVGRDKEIIKLKAA